MQKYVNNPSKIIITHYCRRVVDILCLEFWRSLAIGSNDMQVCESKKNGKLLFVFHLFWCEDVFHVFACLLSWLRLWNFCTEHYDYQPCVMIITNAALGNISTRRNVRFEFQFDSVLAFFVKNRCFKIYWVNQYNTGTCICYDPNTWTI